MSCVPSTTEGIPYRAGRLPHKHHIRHRSGSKSFCAFLTSRGIPLLTLHIYKHHPSQWKFISRFFRPTSPLVAILHNSSTSPSRHAWIN